MAAAAAAAKASGCHRDVKDSVIWIELTKGMRFYSVSNPYFLIDVENVLSGNRFNSWYPWTNRSLLATYNVTEFTIRSSDGLPVYTMQLQMRDGSYHVDYFTVISPSESNAIATLACPWPTPARTVADAYVIPKNAGTAHRNTIRAAYIGAFAAYMLDVSKACAKAAAAKVASSGTTTAPALTPASAAASAAASR